MSADVHPYSTEALALFDALEQKLERRHCAELAASAIAPDVAKLRGYYTATNRTQLQIAGFADYQARVPAVVLPLWNVWGKPGGLQLKPDHPRPDAGKYETMAGSRVLLDVNPICQPELINPAKDLWVTEGVKKGDSGASRGLCIVSLMAGVYGWRGRNQQGGKVLLPDWEGIALNGRRVFVCFDSDAAINPMVREAELRLADALTAKDAKVYVIRIPAPVEGCDDQAP